MFVGRVEWSWSFAEVCGTDYDTNTTLLSGGKECYCISYT